jgi:antitoxin (DNA-binding transcriptional repressor) of toxin-antitoxin stability system
MSAYRIHDAQQQLETLIAAAQQGEEVLILDGKNRAVRLVPVTPARAPRQPGSSRGRIIIADDFDAPLADFEPYQM